SKNNSGKPKPDYNKNPRREHRPKNGYGKPKPDCNKSPLREHRPKRGLMNSRLGSPPKQRRSGQKRKPKSRESQRRLGGLKRITRLKSIGSGVNLRALWPLRGRPRRITKLK